MIAYALAAALSLAAPMMQTPMKETRAQRDARMQWWRDARFGMFIHWGLYALPAGEWGNQKGHGEWIRETAQIPVEEYEKFRDQFNPTAFDPKQWAKIAKQAGVRYVVITTKHHDGFGLFDSKHTDWDVMASPFKRDIMRELSDAVRAEGLVMGWYHSIMDWHHPDYLPRRSWEETSRPAAGAEFPRFVDYLRSQVTELLTNYGPIGVMWFDGEWEATWNDGWGRPLYDLCRTLQPNTIVNNRVSNSRAGSMEAYGMDDRAVGDYSTPEQYIPPTGLPGVDWETCMTMNDHWGWNKNDKNWKSSTTLIRNLVDVASKGGNYLLNVGPMADGRFPQESIDRLAEIGRWMDVNSESIYGTTASRFKDLPWGRSTTKAGDDTSTLYFHVFEWPKDGELTVPGLGNDVISAELLGKGAVPARREGTSQVVSLPAQPAHEAAWVVKLVVKGAPVVYTAPRVESPSQEFVKSATVKIDSGSTEMQVRYTVNGADPDENSPLYTGPITVTDTSTIRAASFHKGKLVSPVTTMTFTKVKPWTAVEVAQDAPHGLALEEFEGDWDKLPDFSNLVPRWSGPVDTIELDTTKTKPEEYVGRRYTGFIVVPDDDMYTFVLTSDDGSALWIDGKLVVDHDGLHSAEPKVGQVALTKGAHRIVVGWFNKTGGAALGLDWGVAGTALRTAKADDFRR